MADGAATADHQVGRRCQAAHCGAAQQDRAARHQAQVTRGVGGHLQRIHIGQRHATGAGDGHGTHKIIAREGAIHISQGDGVAARCQRGAAMHRQGVAGGGLPDGTATGNDQVGRHARTAHARGAQHSGHRVVQRGGAATAQGNRASQGVVRIERDGAAGRELAGARDAERTTVGQCTGIDTEVAANAAGTQDEAAARQHTQVAGRDRAQLNRVDIGDGGVPCRSDGHCADKIIARLIEHDVVERAHCQTGGVRDSDDTAVTQEACNREVQLATNARTRER